MADRDRAAIAVGSEVRIRPVAQPGLQHMPKGIEIENDVEAVVAIVPSGHGGLHRLTPRTPLGGSLLGHCVGDVVSVVVAAGTVRYRILAVEPSGFNMNRDAGVAEPADAAVLKTAPSEDPGSSPGTRTSIAAVTVAPVRANGGPVVQVGDLVDIRDGQLEERWGIVPRGEGDPPRRLISEDAPMAVALLGHRPGEVVLVRAPSGLTATPRPVAILAVKPAEAYE